LENNPLFLQSIYGIGDKKPEGLSWLFGTKVSASNISKILNLMLLKHLIELAKLDIEQFLTFLAVEKKVSPSTQNQAFSAILFATLYHTSIIRKWCFSSI